MPFELVDIIMHQPSNWKKQWYSLYTIKVVHSNYTTITTKETAMLNDISDNKVVGDVTELFQIRHAEIKKRWT